MKTCGLFHHLQGSVVLLEASKEGLQGARLRTEQATWQALCQYKQHCKQCFDYAPKIFVGTRVSLPVRASYTDATDKFLLVSMVLSIRGTRNTFHPPFQAPPPPLHALDERMGPGPESGKGVVVLLLKRKIRRPARHKISAGQHQPTRTLMECVLRQRLCGERPTMETNDKFGRKRLTHTLTPFLQIRHECSEPCRNTCNRLG